VWSAAILAGGSARRFGGRDKSALVVDGRRIIDRQIDVLEPVVGELLLVGRTAWAGAPSGVRIVPDRMPGRGPLGGLHAALCAARGDPIFVVACDMPFLEAPLVRHLLELAAGADAAVPRTDRGYHPLCAAYARTCLPAVERRLAEGRLTMIDLLDDLRIETLEAAGIDAFGPHRRLLANINSPAEYRELDTGHDHAPPS
jgi:molybdopterin-guanine dinucleotide biosynthesis protein A